MEDYYHGEINKSWALNFCHSDLYMQVHAPPLDLGMLDNITYQVLHRILNASNDSRGQKEQTEMKTEPNFPWVHIILAIICSLGICGNVLNLVVLTKKRISNPLRRLEKAASVGLTALALSDLLFCITVFPYTFLDGQLATWHKPQLLVLYYRVYGISAINLFLMSSTWLVVELALERYIVLYYPLRAQCVLGLRRTKVVIISVFVMSAVATLPYFINNQVVECVTFDGERLYEIKSKWEKHSSQKHLLDIYEVWVWPFLATFMPLTLLLFCNIRLVQGLRQVPFSRRKLRGPGQHLKETNNRITLTLIIIVFMAIALITPAEILKLLDPYKRWHYAGHIASNVANVLQAVNFAFNFILYCTLDHHFRRICTNIILGCCFRNKGSPPVSDVILMVNMNHYSSPYNRQMNASAHANDRISKERLYS